MGTANERRRYIVTPSLIGWAHAQDDLCVWVHYTKMKTSTIRRHEKNTAWHIASCWHMHVYASVVWVGIISGFCCFCHRRQHYLVACHLFLCHAFTRTNVTLFKGPNMIVCVLLVSNSRGWCLAAPGDHGRRTNCARPALSASGGDNEVDHAVCLKVEFQIHTVLSNENGKFYTTMIYPCFSRSVCFSMGSHAWWKFGLCSSGGSLMSRWRDAPRVREFQMWRRRCKQIEPHWFQGHQMRFWWISTTISWK